MEKLDKVISGLECCGDNRCDDCPYDFENDLSCHSDLTGDTLDVIRRLVRKLKYARDERDAAIARNAKIVGELATVWMDEGEEDGEIR